MSEQEEIILFDRIRENIQQAQRQLFKRKVKLGETIVVANEKGMPMIVKAADFLKHLAK